MRLGVIVAMLFLSPPVLAEPGPKTPTEKAWMRYSDIQLTVLVATSIATQSSWKKRGIATGLHLVNYGLNVGLKALINEPRPDEDEPGQPSGHAQSAGFSTGLMCYDHSDLICGLAFLGTVGVAVGRVKGNRHSKGQAAFGVFLGFVGGRVAPGAVIKGEW